MSLSGLYGNLWAKCTQKVKTTATGMPYLDNRTSGKWPTHPKGATLEALPYSSVIMQDGDIFYNRSLATYYSALKNPYSVLYKTQAGAPNSEPASKRASAYGVVCSTFGSYTVNPSDPVYRVCKELRASLRKVTFSDLYDLEAGMLLVSHKHARLIADVGFDDDVFYIVTMEACPPQILRCVYKGEKAVQAYLDQCYAENYLLFRCPNAGHKLTWLDDYATDVIFDHGNNTWYRRGDTIKAYIPSGAKRLYYRLQGADKWKNLDVSSKLVNLTPVIKYNRTYEVTTNKNNKVYALVTQVQPSVAVLKGDMVTLKTHSSNVQPIYWRVFKRSTEKSQNQLHDRNGYVITRDLKHYGLIDSNPFKITKSADTKDYIVCIWWDTGFGQCHTEVYPEDSR